MQAVKAEVQNSLVFQSDRDVSNRRTLGRVAALACIAVFGSGCASSYRPSVNQALEPPTAARAEVTRASLGRQRPCE